MMLFLVIIGVMAGIALASCLHERRHRTLRASCGDDSGNHWHGECTSEDRHDFDAGDGDE